LALDAEGYDSSVARLAALVLFLLVASMGLARASGAAPADEYFGPFKQSILEIRNRLMRFERESDRELARSLRGIDSLEITIEDWYRHYPRDPWIPGFSHRLSHVYSRARAHRDAYAERIARLAAI
jgi:hypothetical protein